MSAGDRDTLAALLLQHQPFMIPVDPASDCKRCVDHPWESDEDDAAHVADVILESDWLAARVRAAQTQGWDEGAIHVDREWQHSEYNADDSKPGYEFWDTDLSANPYRLGDTQQP